VQQHFSPTAAEPGKNREMFISQWHPSHQQIPIGAAVLQHMATITTQATHWRKESTPIVLPIISSIKQNVNNISDGKPRISEHRQFSGAI
jgi:hypothetical protein